MREKILFQPPSGNHGCSDFHPLATTEQVFSCFNPSQEITAVPTQISDGRYENYRLVSTPLRKSRPFRRNFFRAGHSGGRRFQPLSGNHGRSDRSYPQWESTIDIVAYLFSLWINHTILPMPIPPKLQFLSH